MHTPLMLIKSTPITVPTNVIPIDTNIDLKIKALSPHKNWYDFIEKSSGINLNPCSINELSSVSEIDTTNKNGAIQTAAKIIKKVSNKIFCIGVIEFSFLFLLNIILSHFLYQLFTSQFAVNIQIQHATDCKNDTTEIIPIGAFVFRAL